MPNKWAHSPFLTSVQALSELWHMILLSSVKLSLFKAFFHHTWLWFLQVGATSVCAVPKPALLFVRCCIPSVQTRLLLPSQSKQLDLFVTGTSHSPSSPWLLLPSEHQLLKTWCQRSWNAALDRFGAGCLHFHPFPALPAAPSFTLSKQVEQLVRSLGRARFCKCLFWVNALLMLLSGRISCTANWQKVNKITFLSPLSTCSWWELFLSQAFALSLWLVCGKVAQEKTKIFLLLHEQRWICSPWVKISTVRAPEDLGLT